LARDSHPARITVSGVLLLCGIVPDPARGVFRPMRPKAPPGSRRSFPGWWGLRRPTVPSGCHRRVNRGLAGSWPQPQL